MSTTTFEQPDFTSDSAATYKAKIDNSIQRLAETGNQFTVQEMSAPGWGVMVNGGVANNGQTIQPANITGIARPATGSRIDRVFFRLLAGTFGRVVGEIAPAGTTPTPPALPANAWPLAQILLNSSDTLISNSMILDERPTIILPEAAGTLIKPYFRVRLDADQLVAVNAYDKLRPDTVDYDPMSQFQLSDNTARPTVAGVWSVTAKIRAQVTANAVEDIPVKIAIYKNGTLWAEQVDPRYSRAVGAQLTDVALSTTVTADGATDFFDFYAWVTGSAGHKVLAEGTYIDMSYIGPL